MDAMTADRPRADLWRFEGRGSDFFGIVLVNLLLTMVTLGIYRFWGKTRVRQYLWTQSHFADEPLEYTGTGLEKLIGAVLALLLFSLPLFVVSFIAGIMMQALPVAAFLLLLIIYPALIWLLGVALYRSRRYMFSRTAWRGVRGGMAGNGFAYGGRFLKLTLFQFITLGFATPFVTTRLWNALMNDAKFGSLAVTASADWRQLQGRFLLGWGAAFVAYVVLIAAAVLLLPQPGQAPPADPLTQLAQFGTFFALAGFVGLVVGLAMLSYLAALQRELWGSLRIGTLRTEIDIKAADLLGFWLVNIVLVVFTLGLGVIMMPYRIFSFSARRVRITGTLDVAALQQTDLAAPRQGDGLADAFDIAAF
jgi:uncharacterized membrane protein YjgN (DUF898 family)